MLLQELWKDAVSLTEREHRTRTTTAVVKTALATDSYKVTTLHRLRQRLRGKVPGAGHFLRLAQTAVYGVELGADVELGEGVYFLHPLGIVVGGNAKIGNRVRFMGNNTVGTARDNGYPIIEDDVTIGAGARILGPVRVGARSVIGANAVVIRDVPPDSIAVGVPAVVKPRRDATDADLDTLP